MRRGRRRNRFVDAVIFKSDDELRLLRKLSQRRLRLLLPSFPLKRKWQRDERNHRRSALPRNVRNHRRTTAARAAAEPSAEENEFRTLKRFAQDRG